MTGLSVVKVNIHIQGVDFGSLTKDEVSNDIIPILIQGLIS